LGIGKKGRHLLKMPPIGLPVGGIDHQKVFIRREAVEIGVVEGAPMTVGDHRVMCKTGIQGGGVVGKDVLQERERPGTADDETTHVGYVEDPGPLPRREMFFHNAGSILERHMPAAEIDHRRAKGDVLFMQNCL
jgi:hypothetical protein